MDESLNLAAFGSYLSCTIVNDRLCKVKLAQQLGLAEYYFENLCAGEYEPPISLLIKLDNAIPSFDWSDAIERLLE